LIKLIVKLAIVALVGNAVVHVMTAYLAHYKFVDGVQQTMLFGNDKSLNTLRSRVVQLAVDYDLPIGEDDFTLTRETFHTIVDGSYTRSIDLIPGFSRPWKFTFHSDTFSEAPITGR
jgi:hypothetical protein